MLLFLVAELLDLDSVFDQKSIIVILIYRETNSQNLCNDVI